MFFCPPPFIKAPAAAFPAIATTNSFGSSSRSTSTSMPLPAGIASGDLLIILFASENNGAAVSTMSGWNVLVTGAASGGCDFDAFYRVADGSEGSTVSISHGNRDRAAWSMRITGYQGTPEGATLATGSSSSPNPGSLTPSWGSAATLWIAFAANATGSAGSPSVSAYPANYNDNQNTVADTTSDGVRMSFASRELTAASEDPGTFTLSGSDNWVAGTIAIQPA